MSKIEKNNTNTSVVGIRDTPERASQNVLYDSIAPTPFNVFGSPDDELTQLAQEPLFQMYANVGPEIYEIISRTNPILKAVVDLAKEIVQDGDQ